MKAPHPKSRAAISTSPQGGGGIEQIAKSHRDVDAKSEFEFYLPLAGRSTRREPRRVGGLSA
jgi:hypothetical protein